MRNVVVNRDRLYEPDVPWANNGTEIVFTQMTKTGLFTSWTDGNHISDLDSFILNDHSINKEFHRQNYYWLVLNWLCTRDAHRSGKLQISRLKG